MAPKAPKRKAEVREPDDSLLSAGLHDDPLAPDEEEGEEEGEEEDEEVDEEEDEEEDEQEDEEEQVDNGQQEDEKGEAADEDAETVAAHSGSRPRPRGSDAALFLQACLDHIHSPTDFDTLVSIEKDKDAFKSLAKARGA